ncbi:aminopeptidase N [Thiovibrio frasassiensis]|uniref:Aminopeptidase N n=1 Tax=Thiovibrio frasassiensis TaxID=2984131 RepID=A0A9X4MEI1_9BACT|nr:aminopeptidase N [Thiovibrio frasassiensis]MDG4474630.1 aminopeptidase N [Thiovibrio frasassiensis]
MDSQAKTILLKDYRPPAYLIEEVALAVDLFEERARVCSRLVCRRNIGTAPDAPLVLQGEDLVLKSVALDGVPLTPDQYRLEEESLTIPTVGERFLLAVETELYPQKNTSLDGLYRSSSNFCTQCEAEGFRKITYFLDRPDVLARYEVTISAEQERYPVLLANGNLVETGVLPEGRHYARWQDPFPKPSYLFAMVAGNLVKIADTFVTRSGRSVALEIYVQAHNQDKCAHAMASLKKAMAWDEETFGLEYDLDQYMIVAVDDFNMGAMENKGLNLFNSKYVLARPDTATDADYEGIEAVIGHEYFHNWTGNRVTCRDWFQLSLKEGLTVFRDQQFTADQVSAPVKRIHDVRLLRNVQFPEDNGPMAHPVRPDSYMEINNFYTVTIYEKGAEIIRMLHTLLGVELFRQGLALYLTHHDGRAATTDDFVQAMAEVSGRDLAQFKRWYTQAGTPRLTVQGEYDPEARTYTLRLAQATPATPGQPEKEPLHIPVALGLLDGQGKEMPLTCPERQPEAGRNLFELRETQETIRFSGVPEQPRLSILRNFSAPLKVEYGCDEEELLFLFRYDRDPFNRWEAGQCLASRLLLGLVEDFRKSRPLQLDERFVAACGRLLAEEGGDKGFLALLLTLPSEEYLAEQMAVVDVEAIHAARTFARQTLARSLRPQWEQGYAANRSAGPYRYEPELAGQRALRNLCLAYLMSTEDDAATQLALAQFRGTDNMTDQMAAFAGLAHSGRPERQQAIADFYQQWQGDSLVLDKWFAVQATAPLPETLAAVQALMDHPAFQLKNPNKVRALLGSFAAGNPVCFHEVSGRGYAFLAEQILALDPLNPQVAARLAARLGRGARYDAGRQGLMRTQLERIAAIPSLSRDVYEVVSKSLG